MCRFTGHYDRSGLLLLLLLLLLNRCCYIVVVVPEEWEGGWYSAVSSSSSSCGNWNRRYCYDKSFSAKIIRDKIESEDDGT